MNTNKEERINISDPNFHVMPGPFRIGKLVYKYAIYYRDSIEPFAGFDANGEDDFLRKTDRLVQKYYSEQKSLGRILKKNP